MRLYVAQILFLPNLLGIHESFGQSPKPHAPLEPGPVPQAAVPESELIHVPGEEVLDAAVICFRRGVCDERVVDSRAAAGVPGSFTSPHRTSLPSPSTNLRSFSSCEKHLSRILLPWPR